jgi:ketosteroid isomerase-like protein
MSQENVELMMRFYRPFMSDGASVVRDGSPSAYRDALVRVVDPACEIALATGVIDDGASYRGLDGLIAALADWMAPWATYRVQVIETFDLGDRVLILLREFGRVTADGEEISHECAHVWTFRSGKIIRWETSHVNRAEALKAVGLEE